MANECRCGRRHIPAESTRAIWTEEVYVEWDTKCPNGCGDTPVLTMRNRETGEEREFSPNQLWELWGGAPDQVGLMSP